MSELPVLACVAPPAYRGTLMRGLACAGIKVRFSALPGTAATGASGSAHNDPYALARYAERLRGKVAGMILVAPRRRSPRRVTPGPLVGSLPAGIIFSDRPEDLGPWLEAVRAHNDSSPTWAVMAMNRRSYIERGRLVASWLRSANGPHVKTWFSDVMSRYDICERLAEGPRLAVYVGHGRARGFSGYMGLRWHHLIQVPAKAPCGTVIAFSCDTLKRERGIFPFGCQWVTGGRAISFFGSVDAVTVKANAQLAHVIGSVFESRTAETVGQVMQKTAEKLNGNPKNSEAYRAFRTYRLIGNPLQPLY